jgi:hypothetical protein
VAAVVGVEPPAGGDALSDAVPLVVADRGISGPDAPAALSRLGEDESSASAGRIIDSSWLGPSVAVELVGH